MAKDRASRPLHRQRTGRPPGSALPNVWRKKGDRWADTPFFMSRAGSPALNDALAFIDCSIERVHEAGDHFVVLGRVLSLEAEHSTPLLVFYRGEFHELATDDQSADTSDAAAAPSSTLEHNGAAWLAMGATDAGRLAC